METLVEILVGIYLTRGGTVFISPQFSIAWDKIAQQGGACPDYVALDFGAHEFLVVEVSQRANLSSLYEKIGNRHIHWFPLVRRHLEKLGIIDERWKARFLGFVRRDYVSVAKERFFDQADVTFYALEDAILEYQYSLERKNGLP